MAGGTRSSARLSANSSPQSAENNSGTKRKAEDSPTSSKSKRDRPSKASKEQKTIEETMTAADDDNDTIDVQAKDNGANGEGEFHYSFQIGPGLLTRIRY